MRTLRFLALSDDGTSLVVAMEGTDVGAEVQRFELPLDDRLLAATRAGSRLLDQVDDDRGTRLPPRVIQSRIRAGESPEQVAESSGMNLGRVQRFARPVLQERERIAEQARAARVRLTDDESAPALQQLLADRLRLLGTDLDAVRWDAARGADGVWQVTAAWSAGPKSGTTRWAYDVSGRSVSPADAGTADFAAGTRLVRAVPEVPAGVSTIPSARSRPAPPADPFPPGSDDATGEPRPAADRWTPPQSSGPALPSRTVEPDADLDDIAEHDTLVLGRPVVDEHRTPVPAWEDIVFGLRRQP